MFGNALEKRMDTGSHGNVVLLNIFLIDDL